MTITYSKFKYYQIMPKKLQNVLSLQRANGFLAKLCSFCLVKRHLLTLSPRRNDKNTTFCSFGPQSVCLFIVFPCQHCCILCVWHLYGIKWVMERAICVWNILWAACNLGTPKLLGTLVGNFMWAPESSDWDTMHVGFVSQTILETVLEKLQLFVVCLFMYIFVVV